MGTTRTTFNQEVADDELTFRVIGCAIEVQLKTVSKLLPVHDAQLLTYMRLPGVQKGLLINFHSYPLKMGFGGSC
jgi:GxxExxY protein